MIIIAAKKNDPEKILMNYNCMGKKVLYTQLIIPQFNQLDR